jgi:hypothetical protein
VRRIRQTRIYINALAEVITAYTLGMEVTEESFTSKKPVCLPDVRFSIPVLFVCLFVCFCFCLRLFVLFLY